MQNQQAERFTFTDDRSNTKIVFLPQILRGNRRITQLDYQGLEGKFTFRGDEIKLQQSNLGLLICITLKTNTETEGVDFALVLPSVNLTTQKRQDFETVAIATTRKRKTITNQDGVQFDCKFMSLKGCAENLSMVGSSSKSSSEDWQNPSWFPESKKHEDWYKLMDFQRF